MKPLNYKDRKKQKFTFHTCFGLTLPLLFACSFILFLSISVGLTAQNKDGCIQRFYAPDNDLLNLYTICDTLELRSKTDRLFIRQIIKEFSSAEIAASVNALKADSILNQFHSQYARTEATEGISLKDYVQITETDQSKGNFFKHTQLLDTFADSLISHTDIIHVSVFYFNPVLESEVFIYECGARMAEIFEVKLKQIYNSPLASPLFPYEENKEKAPYAIGLETRRYTKTIVVPVQEKGEVKFNVRVIVCKGCTHYRYDADGNLTQKTSKTTPTNRPSLIVSNTPLMHTWFYSWHANGMLKTAHNTEGAYTAFEYDALGRRTAKINPRANTLTRFLWDGNTPLHQWTYPLDERPKLTEDEWGNYSYEKEEPQTELTTWVFDEGTFVPCAKLVGNRRYSIITDHLGTSYEAYDEKGEKIWACELDVYGKVRTFEGEKNFIPFRFQGQYEDAETGLYYNRFRYYSPDSGSFISQDPIGLASGEPNFYAYVHDTNSQVDIFGLIIVYRAVNSAQETAVKAGTSIQPKDINANYSIQEHVENGRLNTRYISTTKDINRAEFYAKSNNATIIAIDTDKLDPKKVIDISNGIDPQTGKPLKGKAFGYSTKDAEVLINGEIPKGAYTTVKKCH